MTIEDTFTKIQIYGGNYDPKELLDKSNINYEEFHTHCYEIKVHDSDNFDEAIKATTAYINTNNETFGKIVDKQLSSDHTAGSFGIIIEFTNYTMKDAHNIPTEFLKLISTHFIQLNITNHPR